MKTWMRRARECRILFGAIRCRNLNCHQPSSNILNWNRRKFSSSAKPSSSLYGTPYEVKWDGSAKQQTIQQAADAIYRDGFVVMHGVFDEHELASISRNFMGHTDKVIADLRSSGLEIGIGSKSGFHEVCQRSPGRYDVTTNFKDVPESSENNVGLLMEQVLGPDYKQAFCGVVYSEPGSSDQLWHADSLHLYSEMCPPNLVNCLIAFHDIPIEMGPTELVPGSHVLTNHYCNQNIKNGEGIVYQSEQNNPENIGAGDISTFCKALPAGSVLIFDDRILHRGRANLHSLARYVGYLSYRRSWFEPYTHFEATRSLYECIACSGAETSTNSSAADLAECIRGEFPALGDHPDAVFVDGAGGSQVHSSVIEAVSQQMRRGAANLGGYYPTSELCMKTTRDARDRAAAFLNCDPLEVTFGHNMTSITSHIAHALKFALSPGDNVVLSRLEHDANAGLWVRMAEEAGCEIRWVPVVGPTCELDIDLLESSINSRTRLVACGYAANSVGTINDVARVCAASRSVGAYSYVDAVHYAPHGLLDVQAVACDFLACSPYKFFGPHSGLLYGRKHIMETLPTYKIRTATNELPSDDSYQISRWELGTANFEALAGVTACVDYIAGIGVRFGNHCDASSSTRQKIIGGWAAIGAHEQLLKVRFVQGAKNIKGLHIYGITEEERLHQRTATFAVGKVDRTTGKLWDPDELTRYLTSQGIYCTSGNHYCTFWEDALGLSNEHGATRLGFLHYNTAQEVDRVLETLESA